MPMNSPDSLWDSTPDQGVHSSFKQTEAEKIIQLEILVDKFDALRNLLLDDGHRILDCLSLIHGDILRNRERLLNSVSAELDLAGEELAAEHVLLNVSGLDHTRLTVETSDHRGGEHGTSVSHRQSSGTSTFLGSHDLITTELNSLGDGGHVELGNEVVGELAEQGNDGRSSVSTNDGDVALSGLHVEGLSDELASADAVELSHTHNLARIMDARLLEGLREDRNSGVHGVANHEDAGLGASSGASLGEVHGNTSVGVEQIVSGHTGLSGHTSGDDHNIGAIEHLEEVVLAVVTLDLDPSVNVGEIHSHTGSADDIVQGEARNVGVGSHQERHGLTNTTSSSENGNLSTLRITLNSQLLQKT